MRYFKNPQNELFGVEEGQDFLIQTDWVLVDEEELKNLTAPSKKDEKINRMLELRYLLSTTDYKVLPDYDKPNDDIKRQRQKWRDELRNLEA